MRNFLLGVLLTLLLLVGGGYGFLRLGLLAVEADTPSGGMETWLANVGRKASIGRAATKESNPVPKDDDSIRKGLRVYVEHCQDCHGGAESDARRGRNMYPRAPQLRKHCPGAADAELFWIVRHGIRLTGMPAYGSEKEPMLATDEMWRVVLFMKSSASLPPAVLAEWKKAAPAPTSTPGQTPAGAAASPGQAPAGTSPAPTATPGQTPAGAAPSPGQAPAGTVPVSP